MATRSKRAGTRVRSNAARGARRGRLAPRSRRAGSTPRKSPSPSTLRPSRSLSHWCATPAARRSARTASPSADARCCWRACRSNAVQPTPFQRDLSPTHAKRLAVKIDETAAFLDPLIVVRGEDGRLWTPNGRHRLAAGKVLGLKQITVLISPDESLAYRILALNTEKAHNLKDRSLEVIRMARNLAKRSGARTRERFRRGVRSRGAADARDRLREVAALRRRRLQRVSQEGRPLQRPDPDGEPATARRLRRAPHGDRRARQEHRSPRCRRAGSSPRTCATTSSPASTRCASTRRRRATARRRCRSGRR